RRHSPVRHGGARLARARHAAARTPLSRAFVHPALVRPHAAAFAASALCAPHRPWGSALVSAASLIVRTYNGWLHELEAGREARRRRQARTEDAAPSVPAPDAHLRRGPYRDRAIGRRQGERDVSGRSGRPQTTRALIETDAVEVLHASGVMTGAGVAVLCA